MSRSAELMRSVLAAAERFDSPDDALQDRVWAAVEQRVDAGDPGLSISDGSGAAIGSGSAGWLTPLKVLAVVGVIGLAAGAIALVRSGPEPEVAMAVLPEIEAPVEPSEAAPTEPPHEPAVEVVAPPAEPAVEASKPEPSRARKQRQGSELDATDSLSAEVELLRRARAAANAGNHGEALSALKEHQRRFPRGKLARERDMSRLRALCALGRHADAKTLAKTMLARDGSDVLRAKLEKTCAGSIP